MARFDVVRGASGTGIYLDCQSDLLQGLPTRFVVPLIPPEECGAVLDRLNPVFEIKGQSLAMYTQYCGAIRKQELGEVITSLSDHDIKIQSAIDMLTSGF